MEPYLVFESAPGAMLLHGWQRSGAGRHTPPPRWCNLPLDDIEAVEILPARFAQPHPGFNPDAAQFHRVLYACDRVAIAFEGAPPKARLRPVRRGPPESRTSRAAATAPPAFERCVVARGDLFVANRDAPRRCGLPNGQRRSAGFQPALFEEAGWKPALLASFGGTRAARLPEWRRDAFILA